jgi:hypothetical protein
MCGANLLFLVLIRFLPSLTIFILVITAVVSLSALILGIIGRRELGRIDWKMVDWNHPDLVGTFRQRHGSPLSDLGAYAHTRTMVYNSIVASACLIVIWLASYL